MEMLNHCIDDLAQDNSNDPSLSTDMVTEAREMQERVNPGGSLSCVCPNLAVNKSSGMMLREIKARESEIIRKGIKRLEKEIQEYIGIYVSKDQVNKALIKKCKTTVSQP